MHKADVKSEKQQYTRDSNSSGPSVSVFGEHEVEWDWSKAHMSSVKKSQNIWLLYKIWYLNANCFQFS